MAKRRIRTMFDDNPHCNGIPIGRLGDVAAKLTPDDRKRTLVVDRMGGIGAGVDLYKFGSEEEARNFLYREEEKPNCRWRRLYPEA